MRSIVAGGDGFNTLGIAGGIPGTAQIYGTENSGVVVSFDASVVGSGTTGGRVAGHVAIGYRFLNVKADYESNGDSVNFDVNFRGPWIGLSLSF